MKKNLLIAIVCVLGLFGSLNAQKTVTIGQGETSSSTLPFNNSYNYSVSQQIYNSSELKIDLAATLESIAFKSATENTNESYIQVYMMNTSMSSFNDTLKWFPVTENDKVYEGYIATTGKDQWSNIKLNTPFICRPDNNLVVCVNVCYKYELSTSDQDEFYTYTPETAKPEDIYSCSLRSSDSLIDVTKVTSDMFKQDHFRSQGQEKNQIQLVLSEYDGINVNFKSIDLGNIASGEYWNEKTEEAVIVRASSYYTNITSVTCSDTSFFKLPKNIEYKAIVEFELSYDKTAEAGEKTAEITITGSDDEKVVIPIKAKVYEAVSPDVFELAKEITFTDGKFTDEPDSTQLYDDYLLPNERLDSYAPDAAYKLELEEESLVLVDIEGTNAKFALYDEKFNGKEGPSFDNVVTGRENIISTAFTYDFEDTKLDDFVIEDYDEFKDYTWHINKGKLLSYAFVPTPDYSEPYYVANRADERIITKTAYTITPNSVLTLDVNRIDNSTFLNLYVEVTKDGKEFFEMEWLNIPPNYYDEYTDLYGEYQVERRIDLGAKFAAMELEYGEYQISLYHSSGGGGAILVDNLTLTERTTVIPAGKYYLVTAAEDAFKVTVTLGEPKEEEPVNPETPADTLAAPVVTATATSDSTIVLTWNAVEGATSYNVYQGTDTVALATAVKDTTYTVSGLKAETEYSFTVTAVNENGESAKSAVAKATTLKGVDGIEELNAAVSIYPNPVQNELFIATEVNVKEVAIYDIYGRMTKVYGLQTTDFVHSIDIADLNSGIYFVKVVTDNGDIVKRFVKE